MTEESADQDEIPAKPTYDEVRRRVYERMLQGAENNVATLDLLSGGTKPPPPDQIAEWRERLATLQEVRDLNLTGVHREGRGEIDYVVEGLIGGKPARFESFYAESPARVEAAIGGVKLAPEEAMGRGHKLESALREIRSETNTEVVFGPQPSTNGIS